MVVLLLVVKQEFKGTWLLKNDGLWWECLRRRCELKQQSTSEKGSALQLDFYAVIFAYEKLQSEKTGRNYRANRTWPMIKKPGGVKATLKKWALSKKKRLASGSLLTWTVRFNWGVLNFEISG
jgi:hypothetical protein